MTHAPIRTLLVDDDEDYCVLTRDLLDDMGHGRYQLEWVTTFEEARQKITQNVHDVCLVDYRLGAENGLDLIRKMIAEGCRTPMIVLTGQGDHEVDVEAMKAGAADYLFKVNLDSHLLERSIRYAIERARTLSSLHDSRQELLRANEGLKKTNEQLKNAQMTLMHAEKMETIGRLAAGVAHEVKNPLAVISFGLDYLSSEFPPNGNETLTTVLQEMKTSVLRADTIIRGLLDFSASDRLEAKDEDLNFIIVRSLQLVRHDFVKNRVTVARRLGENLPRLRLNLAKIEQVFINLFVNAVHAMPQGGTLTVETSLRQASTTHNGTNGRSPVVVAEVSDSGTGIPEHVLPDIFEPFFTTKPLGQGTGLGLSVVKSIVELHAGTIAMANSPEGGARATITFPIEQKEAGKP